MVCRLIKAFNDPDFIDLAQKGLPKLFQLAELQSSRGGGGAGMEVGSLREQVIIALLIRYFGQENISVGRITAAEVDVVVFGIPISIKTITKRSFSGRKSDFAGVKAVWTVDHEAIARYIASYTPMCAILLVRIHKLGGVGGFHFIPHEVHKAVFDSFGRKNFFKVPRPDTNPRGVEFTADALAEMASHSGSVSFPIQWTRTNLEYDIYKRWIDAWQEIDDKR